MLQEMYNLIFGQNGYEKTKIDERYHEAKSLVASLSISSLSDFEMLESIIYKIREELRLPSSSLNRCIKDKQKPLTRKRVDSLLEELTKQRYAFLQQAFQAMHREYTESEQQTSHPQTANEQNDSGSPVEKPDEYELFSNAQAEVKVRSGKVNYLLVRFFDKPDLVLIKQLTMLFFESHLPEGTNILSEGAYFLIVPRYQKDGLLHLPQQEPTQSLDEVAKRLNKEQPSPKEKTDREEATTKKTDEDYYFSLSPEASREDHMTTKKPAEDSLDKLLSEQNEKKKTPEISKESETPESKRVIVERDADELPVTEKKPHRKEEEITTIPEDESQEEPSSQQKDTAAPGTTERTQKRDDADPFLIYEDEEVRIRFNPESKITGELLLIPTNGRNIGSTKEQSLAYLMIFAKFFASALFDLCEAHGTNVFWNAREEQIHVVPRYQQDNLPLTWSPSTQSEEFLTQVRDQLHGILSGSVDTKQQTSSPQQEVSVPKEETTGTDDSAKYYNDYAEKASKEKAEYILRSLDRLP